MGSFLLFAAGASIGAAGTACCYWPRLLGTAAELATGTVKLFSQGCLSAGSRACKWLGLVGKKELGEVSPHTSS